MVDHIIYQESSLPHVLTGEVGQGSFSMTTRSKTKKRLTEEETSRKSPPISPLNQRSLPYEKGNLGKVSPQDFYEKQSSHFADFLRVGPGLVPSYEGSSDSPMVNYIRWTEEIGQLSYHTENVH